MVGRSIVVDKLCHCCLRCLAIPVPTGPCVDMCEI